MNNTGSVFNGKIVDNRSVYSGCLARCFKMNAKRIAGLPDNFLRYICAVLLVSNHMGALLCNLVRVDMNFSVVLVCRLD